MSKHGWTYKKLGDVAEIVGGSTPKTSNPDFWGGEHYWVTPAELGDFVYINKTERTITDEALAKTNLTLLPVGTVLLSSRAPIGKTAITTVPMYCNQGFKNIICSKVLNNKFVYYYINRIVPKLQSLGRGATFKEISKSIVESTTIPVPGMAEQEAIVAELDEINEAIAALQQQVADLDTLAQATFYDMFGDPVTNPKAWPSLKFSDCIKLSSGQSLSAKNFIEGNYPVYGGNGIAGYHNTFNLDGDNIIIGRVGALCGNVRNVNGEIFVTDNAFILTKKKEFNNEFLVQLLRWHNLRQYAREAMQPVISNTTLKNIQIIFPPLALQQEFAAKVEAIEAAKAELNSQIAEMQTLLASRMDYYFD